MALTRFQNTEKLFKEVDDLSDEVEKLRIAYEQFFLGLERFAPEKQREKVQNRIRTLSQQAIQNSRVKFKLQQTVARYNTFVILWDRTLREIEEGRYARDVFRAKLHNREQPESAGKSSVRRALEKSAEDPLEKLYHQYVMFREKNKETTQGLSLDGFKKTLTSQVDAIKKKTQAKGVKFQVVTENGKTKIKAIPKK